MGIWLLDFFLVCTPVNSWTNSWLWRLYVLPHMWIKGMNTVDISLYPVAYPSVESLPSPFKKGNPRENE